VATLDPEGLVIDIREKPTIHHRTLAGIYVVGYDAPPPDGKEDAPYYLRDLTHSGMRVNTYPVNGRWVDIGSPETYQQAQEMMGDG